MSRLKLPKNRFVEESRANKKSVAKLKSTQLVFRIALGLVFLAVAIFVGYRVDDGMKSLSAMKFSRKAVEEFLPEDREPRFMVSDITTLFIGEISRVDGKKELNDFVVLRLDKYTMNLVAISFPARAYFRPFRYFRSIQSDLELDAVKIKSLPVVGDLNSPSAAHAYTFYEIEELLARKLDGYIFVDAGELVTLSKYAPGRVLTDKGKSCAQRWVSYLRGLSLLRIWAGKEAITRVESNLTVSQVHAFSQKLRNIPAQKITELSLPAGKYIDFVDSRGERVNLIPVSAVDELLEDYSVDIRIDREQARVEIFNGSEVNGLGGRFERWITHMGVDVIRVENAPGTWVKRPSTTIFVTDKEKFPLTLDRVKSLWRDPVIVTGRPDFLTTGDIVVILGMDFYRD